MRESLKNCFEPIAGIHIDRVGLMKDFYLDVLDKSFWVKVIAHRRDLTQMPDLTLGDRVQTILMRTLCLLLALEAGPLLQINHLPLHQGRDKDNDQKVLHVEKVDHMILPK